MRITIGTAKWTENLSEWASGRQRTARHAVIYLGAGLAGAEDSLKLCKVRRMEYGITNTTRNNERGAPNREVPNRWIASPKWDHSSAIY